MKRNIRNLVVIAIIIVVAPFTMVAMALAAEPIPHGIRGQYASAGGGAVLLTALGFETNLRPKGPPGAYLFQTFSLQGVYTFERDGTGSFKGLNHLTTLPYIVPNPNAPPPTITVPSSAGSANITYVFHYTVTDDGKITFTADPGTYAAEWKSGPSAGKTYRFDGLSRTGLIMPDGKTITLIGGAPNVMSVIPPLEDMPPTAQMIITSSMVLFYLRD